jgi:hypothetical protein
MTNEVRSVRPLILVAAVLLVPAFAGCINLDGGVLGVCSGQATALKIIRAEPCTEWVIEIDHVSGYAPDGTALQLLQQRMESVVQKNSISIIMDETNIPGDTSWTDAELRALAENTKGYSTSGKAVATHVLYLNGVYEAENNVVGVAFGSQFLAIFQERIEDATSSLLVGTTASEFEQSTLVHEFGHIIGLVNDDIPMQTAHEAATCDTGNEVRPDQHHSDNPESVMFCAVENAAALTSFFGDSAPPNDFDRADRADICAAGGRC